MNWLRKFFSGDNSEIDTKAVLATLAFLVAVVVYGVYALVFRRDLPPNLASITHVFILAALGGAGLTLLNKVRGPSPPPPKTDKPPEIPVKPTVAGEGGPVG
jgi:hypothetical protein